MYICKIVFMSRHSTRQVELQNVYHILDKKDLLFVEKITTLGHYILFGLDDTKLYLNVEAIVTPIIDERRLKSFNIMSFEITYLGEVLLK